MHLSILRPTTPLAGGVGEEVGFELCKSQMNHLLGKPVSQIPILPHQKDGDLQGDLLVNVYTPVP